MKKLTSLGSLLAALVLLATAFPAVAAGPEVQKFERTFPFDDKDHKIGVTAGDVTIQSVQIKNFPDAEDYAKGEKNPNDTKTMWVVFTYTNKGTSDYKCKYAVTIPDPKGGAAWAQDDATRTLDKGKVDDTNRFGMKMKTPLYKQAKTFKVTLEVWKK
ncbi:MAG: hypothetical protein ACHQPI_02265 [Thermoanaerobaculia bacterium]